MHTLRLAAHDVRLQARSRLYVYGIVVALFIGALARLLVSLAPAQSATIGVATVFLATGGTTMLFGASTLVLDRAEGTWLALRVSPISTGAYIAPKVLSLSAFSVLEGAIVYAIAGAPMTQLTPFLLGLSALNLMYALCGIALVAPHDRMTSFLMPGGLIAGVFLQIPIVSVLGADSALLFLLPGHGPLMFMRASYETLAPSTWLAASLSTSTYVAVFTLWATRRVRRHLRIGHR